MTTADPSRRRPVIEVLYVQDCPHYQATLALVERIRAELGIDADLHSTLVADQAAAEQGRFPGSPTVRVDGRDVEPGSDPATEYLVGCRLYRLEHRFGSQPEECWVREALLRAAGPG
jgi:glutaredoxin